MVPKISIPRMSAHGGELVLLGSIANGVCIILLVMVILAARHGTAPGWDAAAFLLVLQSIIGAIKDRWNNRTQSEATRMVADSTPTTKPAEDPAKPPEEEAA